MFVSSSLLGLAANIIVMQLILANWTVPYKFIAQGFGILAGMVINFAFAKTLVFRSKSWF
jgi:putative flippase GtrA